MTRQHDLNELDDRGLHEHLLRAAAANNGVIHQFSVDEGMCYRIGSLTIGPENRDINHRVTRAIRHLVEEKFLQKRDALSFELTDAGYDAANPMHPQSVAILDLLLRIGLCAPKLWAHCFASLPRLARDETLDAISQGALPLPQLVWEWAGTYGHISPLHAASFEADLTDFYDALLDVATRFPVQLSTPAHCDQFGTMPPFADQRVHVVNRSNWFTITPGETESLQALEAPKDLPVLSDAAIEGEDERVGETWVRIEPSALDELRRDSLELLKLLLTVADAKVNQLREAMRPLTWTAEQLVPLNERLEHITSWQRVLHTAMSALEKLPPETRRQKAAGVFAIITTMARPERRRTEQPATPPPEDLKKAAIAIVWQLPRPLRYSMIVCALLVVLTYTVWLSLPDTTKELLIAYLFK